MILDPTISYGTILQICAMLFGGLAVVMQMRSGLQYHGQRLDAVEKEVHELGQLVIAAARTEERVLTIRSDLTAIGIRVTAIEAASRLTARN